MIKENCIHAIHTLQKNPIKVQLGEKKKKTSHLKMLLMIGTLFP